MTNIQSRHKNEAMAWLQTLADNPDGSEKTVDSDTSASIKTVLRNRAFAVVEGRGLAAKWSITKEGRDFLKGASTGAIPASTTPAPAPEAD